MRSNKISKVILWTGGIVLVLIAIVIVFLQFFLDLYFFHNYSGDKKDFYAFRDQTFVIPDDVLVVDAISTATLAAGE